MVVPLRLPDLEFQVIEFHDGFPTAALVGWLDMAQTALLIEQHTLLLAHLTEYGEECLSLLRRQGSLLRDELLHIGLEFLGVKPPVTILLRKGHADTQQH